MDSARICGCASRPGDARGPMSAAADLGGALRCHQPRQDLAHARRRQRGRDLAGEPCPGQGLHDRPPRQRRARAARVLEHSSGPDMARMGRRPRHWGGAGQRSRAPRLAAWPCRPRPKPRHVLCVPALTTTSTPRPPPSLSLPGRREGPGVELDRPRRVAIGTWLGAQGRALPLPHDPGAPRRAPLSTQARARLPARRSRHALLARTTFQASTSRARAASRRLSRAFACSSARHRGASETVMPPHFWRQRSQVGAGIPCARHSRLIACSPRSACGQKGMIGAAEHRRARMRILPWMRGRAPIMWPSFRGAAHRYTRISSCPR
jgi:hypothetical protein